MSKAAASVPDPTDVEIPRATTLLVRDACLCLHTQRAARALSRRFDEAFRHLGITSGQFSLMMSLNRPEPPTISMTADFLAMDRTTLTAALKPLERRGLVAVTVDAKDKRSRRLTLTPAGRRTLANAVPIWTSTHAAVEATLPGRNGATLRAALMALA
jgi:DNA-binding MarR family transcriptional regulator